MIFHSVPQVWAESEPELRSLRDVLYEEIYK
jgi:hypothetical protein